MALILGHMLCDTGMSCGVRMKRNEMVLLCIGSYTAGSTGVSDSDMFSDYRDIDTHNTVFEPVVNDVTWKY